MNEHELVSSWGALRMQLVVSQLAPTFLLITTIGLTPLISSVGGYVVWATIGILLASGILGAVVQFSAATEAQAVAAELSKTTKHSRIAKSISSSARLLDIAKYVTPTIFIAIFGALCAALLGVA